jgi:hypothetical protein
MKTTKNLIDEYNERLFAKLFPEKSEPIKCNFEINPNDEIFNKSLKEIVKIQNNALNACVFEALKNSKN